MFKTYQTKLKNDKILLKNNRAIPVYEYFHQNAQYFGMLERKLFVDLYVRKKPPGDLKKYIVPNTKSQHANTIVLKSN